MDWYSLVNASFVHDVVGANSSKRGLDYFLAGRVLDLERQPLGFMAKVRGSRTEPYGVDVFMVDGEVQSVCTCPMGRTCKHVAAALFEAGDRWGQTGRKGAGIPTSVDGEAAASLPIGRKGLKPGVSGTALAGWAAQAKVSDLTGVVIGSTSIGDGLSLMAWRRLNLRTTVEAVVCAPPMNQPWYPGLRGHPLAAQQLAVAWLEEAVQHRARLLAAERARLERWAAFTPIPRLSLLWHQLLEQRLALRAAGAQPAAIGAEPGERPRLVEDPPAALVAVQGNLDCDGRTRPSATVSLADDGGRASCSCARPRAACPLLLEAADRMLEAMSGPEAERFGAEVVAILDVPNWTRHLRALDLLVGAASSEPSVAIQPLWWELTLGYRPNLRPVDVRPHRSKPGLKVTPRDAARLERGLLQLSDPVDRDAVTLHSELRHLPVGGEAAFARLLDALGRHPRVICDGVQVELVRAPLEFGWSTLADGGLRFVVAMGDVALDDDMLRGVLVNAGRGARALLWLQPERAQIHYALVQPGAVDLLSLVQAKGRDWPAQAVSALMSRREQLSAVVPVQLDRTLRGDEVDPDERPLLRLESQADGRLRVDVRVKPLPGAPAFVPGEGPVDLYAERPERRVFVRRVPEEEAELVHDALSDLPELPELDGWSTTIETADASLMLVSALADRADDFQVEWARAAIQVSRAAGLDSLRLQVSARRDWFGMDGGVSLDGMDLTLAALLEAVLEGKRFVQVDADRFVALSDELRSRLRLLAAAAWTGRNGVELSPWAADLLDPLADGGARIGGGAEWRGRIKAMRAALATKTALPKGLVANLRAYQKDGVRWLQRTAGWAPGAVLADDMGLGKTLQALALLLHRSAGGPALVVAPTSVGFNWLREAGRFAPGLRVIPYRDRDRADALVGLGPGDVLITSWDLMVRDIDALEALKWRTVVLDEAHAIKNADTARARATLRLGGEFTLALTGTPVENRTAELWSLMRVVAPGLLGSQERFRARFVLPIERDQDPERMRVLAELARPFLLRRIKAEVAPDLPPREEHIVEVDLSPAERQLYDTVRLTAIASLSGGGNDPQQRVRVLAALTRLRQLACHPRLVDPESTIPSAKLARLVELVEEVREAGACVLVFSQFTSHLALVRDALLALGVRLLELDGSTPARERQQRVDRFQAGEADAFLISLKAGGTGLNLTRASYVVHMDPWWNPAVEDQATDRSHRIGQDQTVTVYRLVSRGTIEESIIALHADKRTLVAGILDGTRATGPLKADELLQLLQHEAG